MNTLVYVDDCILISKEVLVIQKFISSLKAGTEDFVFMEEVTMNLYLGVDISSFPDKKGFTLYQPLLIDRVIQALNFHPKTTKSATNNTPAGYPLLPCQKSVLEVLGYYWHAWLSTRDNTS